MRNPLLLGLVLLFSFYSYAQSPGQIVKRSSPTSVLDPNNDGYSSKPINTGFTTNDVTQSEIPFAAIPVPFAEPIGDLATGQSGSFTDLVISSNDNTGFMAYYDGTNLIFRLRVGSISSGAKAYSVLIDADFKAGNSTNSSQPDPNYIAPTAQGTGNIGFEWEVLLATGNSTSVVLNDVDGKTNSSIVQVTLPAGSASWQISRALSNNSGNADYFYDFYVPLSAFTGANAITSASQFRMVATTVNSPTSALAGSRSDIWGADDRNYTSTPEEWYDVLGRTPPVTLTKLSSGSVGGSCTGAPVITTASVSVGTVSISGTWARSSSLMDDKATVTVYRYSSSGNLLNTYTSTAAYPTGVSTGSSWTISGITAAQGDYFIAKAKGTSGTLNESECLQSNTIYAACASTPAVPSINCASTKGINGTIPLGATVEIYQVTTTNLSTTASPLTTNLLYTNNASDQTFNYYGANPTTGSACGGNTGIFTAGTTIMFVTTNNGCKSAPIYGCITGSNSNSTLSAIGSNDLAISTPLYPFHNTISGTSASGFTSGQVLRLFVNDVYVTGYTVSASTNAFSFTGVTLKSGDVVKVMRQTSGSCATMSSSATVTCYNQPPLISTDANGKLWAGATTISGTSTANASITLNKTGTTTNSWTTTANGSGAWSITVPALTANDTYTATVSSTSSCSAASLASSTASVVSITTNCPTISGSYTDANTSVSGLVDVTATNSVVRLYVDGTLVGSQTMNTIGANQSWSITSSQPFYNGAVLTASFQSGSNGSEKTNCSNSTVVTCTSPAAPSISPASVTISQGSSVNYSVTSGLNNTWYSVADATGLTYATSIYNTGTNNNFSIATGAFNTTGTYNLRLLADNLSGCPASYSLATVQVNAVILPTRFISINATSENTAVKLVWLVSNEINVDSYYIERSADGWNYEQVGSLPFHSPNAVQNQYAFTDSSVPEIGKFYYRIKAMDKDGHYYYSAVAAVKRERKLSVEIRPNPAKTKTNLLIESAKNQTVTVQLVNSGGKVVKQNLVSIKTGSNTVSISSLDLLPKAVYFVKIIAAEGNTYQKLILE